jgi:ATP-dependent exoDNAse (exonuclease V) alpha subunit
VKVRIKIGKGVTGAVRYVMGPGHDPKTGRFRTAADAGDRVAWIGGTGFSYEIESKSDVDLARREMEFDALYQGNKTKKCVFDCVHIVLAWERGETPTREEMEEAARSQLKKQDMGNAKAVWVSHTDEDYFHLHIVASKLNPDTGRAYDLAGSFRKAQDWALDYEREHGGVIHINRESASELRRAIRQRDVGGVLEAMTKRNATITMKQVERAVQKEIYPEIGAAPGKKRSVELERAQFVNAILSHESVRRLGDELNGPVTRYTTCSVQEAESHVLRAGNSLKTDTGHGVDEEQRAAVLAGKYGTMSAEQVRAFRHCTGEEGLALIDGQAGTGKSFTMAAIRDAYEAEGHRVIGLAFTNKVAKNLAGDGFTHAGTVHRELMNLNNGRTSWDAKTVVMLDETAMLDTRLMAMVTAHAADAGAKLILVGDDRQLSSIDRGGMFAVLKDRHGAAVLSEVRRQYKADERRASEMMAEGNFDAALAIYEKKGAIHWTRTQVEARAELVEKWAHDTAADRDKSRFVFAYTNQDVDLLNVALRAVRKERGELEWKDHTITTAHGRFDFSAGDRIMFTGTDRRIGVENGLAGIVLAIDGTHVAVRLDGREGKEINFDGASFDKFRHGYAGTVYKGQGDTLDQTYLYHSEHWRSAPSYVALTRHREQTHLFVATNTAEDLKALAKQVARQQETRAASQFYQLDGIEPVRPMTAAEILAQFAGEEFQRTAERMEREGRPWPALRPEYRQDNQPPAGLESPAISSIVPPSERPSSGEEAARAKPSRWGDEASPAPGIGQRIRQRWSWRGVAGVMVEHDGEHPNRPGNIRRRRRRGHGR